MGETGLASKELTSLQSFGSGGHNYDKTNIIQDENDPLSQGDLVENKDDLLPYEKNDDNLLSKIKNLIPAHNDYKMYRQKVPTIFSTSINETSDVKTNQKSFSNEIPDISPYHSYDKYIFSYRDLKNSQSSIKFFNYTNYTKSYGPHILLFTILTFPLAFAISFIMSLYYSSLAIYNFYDYYFGDRRHALYRLKTPLKVALLLFLVLLASPLFAMLCGIFCGLYSAFYQITCDFFIWQREFVDPEKGFFGWICQLTNLPHCCPYDITLARETRNIQRNSTANLPMSRGRLNSKGFKGIATGNCLPPMQPDNPYYNQCVQHISTVSRPQTFTDQIVHDQLPDSTHLDLEDREENFKKLPNSRLAFESESSQQNMPLPLVQDQLILPPKPNPIA